MVANCTLQKSLKETKGSDLQLATFQSFACLNISKFIPNMVMLSVSLHLTLLPTQATLTGSIVPH